MDKPVSPRLRLLISLFLVLICIAAYWRVTSLQFTTLDDHTYITRNYHVKAGITPGGLVWAFTTGHGANWHPLTWISHMTDCQLYGMNPVGHHITNLVFHIISTVLLFLMLAMVTGRIWPSAFAAALFGVHPLHVESVAWIAERKDVLSAMFWMLTMLAYFRYVKQPNKENYLLVVAAYILGLLSKPMLVSLPIMLLLLDFWPLGRFNEQPEQKSTAKRKDKAEPARKPIFMRLVLEKAPLFALAAASCVATLIAQAKGGAVQPIDRYSIGVRVANSVVAYMSYIGKTLWPLNLCAAYRHPKDTLPVLIVISCAVALIAITYFSIRARRNRPYITVGWLWYLITLVPVIGLVQVGWQGMADRYMYIPMIGLSIIAAWGVPDLLGRIISGRSWLLAAPVGAILIALTVCTFIQVSYWRDGNTLFDHALVVTNGDYMVRYCCADALTEQGKFKEAEAQYLLVLKEKSDLAPAHSGLGCVYLKQGKMKEAAAELRLSMKYQPNKAIVYNNIGHISALQGKPYQAIDELNEALSIDPNYAEAHYNLGDVYQRMQNNDRAEKEYREAIRCNPDMAEAHVSLAGIMLKKQEIEEVIDELNIAIGINPDIAEAHFCLSLALQADMKVNKAISQAREAIRLKPGMPDAHYFLGILLMQKSDYMGAAKEVETARKLGFPIDPEVTNRISQMLPK